MGLLPIPSPRFTQGGQVVRVSGELLPCMTRGSSHRPLKRNKIRTGRLGPKRGRKCYVTPAFSGVPNKRDKQKSKPTLGVTMMLLVSQSMGL